MGDNIVKKHHVSKIEEKSGCDICCMNIHLYEDYYTIHDCEDESVLTICELCSNKLIDLMK